MSTLKIVEKPSTAILPEWTLSIPEKNYHQAAKSGIVMSSGMLREFHKCPQHYRALTTGMAERKESTAFRIGKAAHKLLLEGEAAFHADFSVGGPVNGRTGAAFGPESRAFRRWLGESGLLWGTTLTPDEYARLRRMRDAVTRHPEIARLFRAGWAERSARMRMEGVNCQIRLDWLRPDGIAVDLKTVEDISRFELDARRFGYLSQFAFYRDGALAAGAERLDMAAVVVEKKAPFRAGLWHFPAEALQPYAEENRRLLDKYRRCRDANRWPTGFEKPRRFSRFTPPAAWMN